MKKKIILAFFLLLAAMLLSSCTELSNCESNVDCKGGSVCINSKCTTLSIYKNLEDSQKASVEKKLDPVLEIVELCETEDPLFNPSAACYKIRTSKYYDWSVCDTTVGPPLWYNMGACYNCIISCKGQ